MKQNRKVHDNQPFYMVIENVYHITRPEGYAVSGKIASGTLKTNDELEIIGRQSPVKTSCYAIEMFRRIVDKATVGDYVCVLLNNVQKSDLTRGQVLATPNTVKPSKEFAD